jgi:hypothetical protein
MVRPWTGSRAGSLGTGHARIEGLDLRAGTLASWHRGNCLSLVPQAACRPTRPAQDVTGEGMSLPDSGAGPGTVLPEGIRIRTATPLGHGLPHCGAIEVIGLRLHLCGHPGALRRRHSVATTPCSSAPGETVNGMGLRYHAGSLRVLPGHPGDRHAAPGALEPYVSCGHAFVHAYGRGKLQNPSISGG